MVSGEGGLGALLAPVFAAPILPSKHWLLWEPAAKEGWREPGAKKGQEGCSIPPAGFLLLSLCLPL